MKFSKDQIRELCAALLGQHRALMEQANLNGQSGARILGVSRSRYTQLMDPDKDTPLLQTDTFLNLLHANDRLELLLSDGTLPAETSRGLGQGDALRQVLGQ